MRSNTTRLGLTALNLLAATLVSTLVAGCAGRQPAPVLATRVDDIDRSCHELLHEASLNQRRMRQLVTEDQHIRANNVETAALDAIFFPPVLVALDFQGAPQTEMKAFQARNAELNKLAAGKGC
jgi:hypothetical protein